MSSATFWVSATRRYGARSCIPMRPHPAHSTAPSQRRSSRMRNWATMTVPVSALCTRHPRITLTLVRSAGTSSRPIRSRCRLRRWELLASLERTLLPSIAEAVRSSPEPSAAGAVPLRVRRSSMGVTPRAAPGGPHLHRICRTAGWRRGAGSNRSGNRFALSQCHDRCGLATASRLCGARSGHQLYDANASRIVMKR